METFYWFDFETFGANPAKDRPAQFAGVRTDHDFNIIDEPLNIYCKPSNDFLPHPQACLITGITPQLALEKGLCEREFFKQIHLELSTAGTCAVGYNNIRFDDEVVRYGFYRNFYDPYAREWQLGNSRWDILDMLRMTHALRPEGIIWPQNKLDQTKTETPHRKQNNLPNGSSNIPSFKLELLSKANGIEHENAHDALNDVYATIAMAKLVKQAQPKLFNYLFGLRDKRLVAAEIDLVTQQPFIHCSGMLGPEHQYCSVMMPLVAHPTNKNSVICIDLCKPFDDFATLSSEAIHQQIFSRQADLPEGKSRLPIKEIHLNKCPAVAPLGVLNLTAQERLRIDLSECLRKAENLKKSMPKIRGQLLAAYQMQSFEPITDPDHALYSGGFFSQQDRRVIQTICQSSIDQLASADFQFDDSRLAEMLFRYRARNAPEKLSPQEQQQWNNYRQQILLGDATQSHFNYQDFLAELEQAKRQLDANKPENPTSQQQHAILEAVAQYGEQLVKPFR